VAAKAPVYHEFLTHMRTNLQSTNLDPMSDTRPGVYPLHRHLTDFLLHFLTHKQIFQKGSPFSFGCWTNVKNSMSRTYIVVQALRVAWYSTSQ
jgi:hypothetical protein